ncbi:hypothetical protein XENTR_v10021829 [Xenopus tropicalis]|uniref:Chromosome 14 open reading frame 39 n=1 Tax=Xenopus tropicalis TaxID=8364 RepID=A0A803JAX8_XENTR|nr:hypothetical protein XENTR_v10021829 [Xenopus tropicalis]
MISMDTLWHLFCIVKISLIFLLTGNIYQKSLHQYKETLRQHQEQYMESNLVKDYCVKKQELDDIQNRVLKYIEQLKREEENILYILEPADFLSYIQWTLRLVLLRKNTNENLTNITLLSSKISDMTAKTKDLELKLKHISQRAENFTEDIKDARSIQHIEERILEEKDLDRSKGKTFSQLFHIPCIPQKLHLKLNKTDREENPSETNQRTSASILSCQYLSKEMKGNQFCSNENCLNSPPTPNLHSQIQLRLVLSQKKRSSKLKSTEIEHTEVGTKEITNIPEDSGHVSEDNYINESYEAMEDYTDEQEASSEANFAVPLIPPSFSLSEIPSTAASTFSRKTEPVNKTIFHDSKTSTTKLCQDTEKHPSFDLFMTSTPKAAQLTIFDSSPFGLETVSDQDESFSLVNTNTASPLKSIGSIFGRMEGDDMFTFPFSSKHSQSPEEEREEFGFTFPFGQDQRSSQDNKEFEPPPSTMKFTFF